MLRILILSTGVLAAVLVFDARSAQARIISYGNPGSHFNVHGMNYGSMKWERKKGNRRPLFHRSRRGIFRRW